MGRERALRGRVLEAVQAIFGPGPKTGAIYAELPFIEGQDFLDEQPARLGPECLA